MSLPVIAGRTYRVDIVWRDSPEIADNDAYVNVWCWANGDPFSEAFYPSEVVEGTWPARWTPTVTVDCLISVAVWCGQLAEDSGVRGECHNDAVAFEIIQASPGSCGIGPELALLLPVLWRRRRY